jgi:hypothetical protein
MKRRIKFAISNIAGKKANPTCCCVKKSMFHPTYNIAFNTKSTIISPKFFFDEYLFQIIRIDKEVSANITIQAIAINVFEGVQSGRLIVLYQAIPTSAK